MISSITVWYGSSDSHTKRKLENVITKATSIIGCDLPSVLSLYTLNRATKIITDSSHPGHGLFQLLPSGRHCRSLRSGTMHINISFFPSVIRLLNFKSWTGLFLRSLFISFYLFFTPHLPLLTGMSCDKKYHQLSCVAIIKCLVS